MRGAETPLLRPVQDAALRLNSDIRAVDERLVGSVAESALALGLRVAAPVVARRVLPLQDTLVARQVVGQLQRHFKRLARRAGQLVSVPSIRQPQPVRQLVFRERSRHQLADEELEAAPVVGRQVHGDFDLLAFLVRFRDNVLGVPAGMDELRVLLVVGVPAHAALAFVGVPMSAESPTV